MKIVETVEFNFANHQDHCDLPRARARELSGFKRAKNARVFLMRCSSSAKLVAWYAKAGGSNAG